MPVNRVCFRKGFPRISLLFCSLFLLLASAPLAAQTTSRLTGAVVDKDDAPLPGVTVTLTSGALIGGARVAESDPEGSFSFLSLAPGEYHLEAALDGYVSAEATQRVRLDRESQVRFQLVLSEFAETIQVVAETPIVDSTQVDAGEVYSEEFLQNARIGVAGRNYLSVIGEPAGSVGTGNPRVFGSTATDNLYLVDGLNTTDPLVASFGTNFNFDAIQELSVLTGGYEAEYGQALGAVVNLVTKSGGNDFAGSLDARYQDESLAEAGDFFDPDVSPTRREQVSATLGGPLVQDDLWFFLSAEQVETQITAQASPTTRVFDGVNYIGKLTWNAAQGTVVVGKIQGDPTDIDNAGTAQGSARFVTPEAQTLQEQGGNNFQLEASSILTPSMLLSARAGFTRGELNAVPQVGDVDTPGFQNIDTGFDFGNARNAQFSDRDRDHYRADLTSFFGGFGGSHEVKAGLEHQELFTSSRNFRTGGFEVSYRDFGAGGSGTFDQNGDGRSAFILLQDSPLSTARDSIDSTGRIESAYVQDSWHPLDRLTVKAGVRWDEAAYDDSAGREVISFGELQPRVGAAWDFGGNGRSVLRASWGRFMHPGSANFSSTLSGIAQGTQRYVAFDFWCGSFGLCTDAQVQAAFPGTPIDFGGDRFYLFDSFGTTPFTTSEALGLGSVEAQHADELIVGFEQQVAPDTSVEVQYVDKRTRDLYEDTCANNPFAFSAIPDVGDTSSYTDPAGCTGFVLGNVAGLERDYTAWIVKAETRFADWLHLRANYTYSESQGNSESLANQSYAAIGADRFPRDFFNFYGRLTDDRQHRVKVTGYALLPARFSVGFDAQWLSGIALDYFADCSSLLAASPASLAALGIDSGIARFCGNEVSGNLFLEPRGSRRGESSYRLDLEVRKDFHLAQGLNLQLIGTVLNALDDEDPTVYRQQELSAAGPWGAALAHTQPRRYEVGARLTF